MDTRDDMTGFEVEMIWREQIARHAQWIASHEQHHASEKAAESERLKGIEDRLNQVFYLLVGAIVTGGGALIQGFMT